MHIAFYRAIDEAVAGERPIEREKRAQSLLAHSRHCFDYIRQSLMCCADTNLELYNATREGISGWGTKKCGNYDDAFKFAEKWRTNDEH